MKEGDGKAALGLAVFFLLPVIIDSAILPITGMHDILVAR
jgi:hypothetical protein